MITKRPTIVRATDNRLVRAVDDVTSPLHALLTLHRTVTSVDNHLREVTQRVLNQIAQ